MMNKSGYLVTADFSTLPFKWQGQNLLWGEFITLANLISPLQ
jgi:hypothetical protein